MDNPPDTFWHLFWGYTIIWILIVLYLATLARRVKKIEKKLRQD